MKLLIRPSACLFRLWRAKRENVAPFIFAGVRTRTAGEWWSESSVEPNKSGHDPGDLNVRTSRPRHRRFRAALVRFNAALAANLIGGDEGNRTPVSRSFTLRIAQVCAPRISTPSTATLETWGCSFRINRPPEPFSFSGRVHSGYLITPMVDTTCPYREMSGQQCLSVFRRRRRASRERSPPR